MKSSPWSNVDTWITRMTPPESNPNPAVTDADADLHSPIWADQHLWVELVNRPIETTDPVLIRRLCDLPNHYGNDPMDVWQGIWNIGQNQRLAHAPELSRVAPSHLPAIAIGSGPSLSEALPRLRELQSTCILVACNAAVDGLLKAGIMPHLVTCVERDAPTIQTICGDMTGITFAGLPIVQRAIVDKFSNHLLITSCNSLFQWAYNRVAPIASGSSAGIQTLAVASRVTTGPVFLIGHDLCRSGNDGHSEIASSVDQPDDGVQIDAASGTKERTNAFWLRLLHEIPWIIHLGERRYFNVANHYRMGARINHIPAADLPDSASLTERVVATWNRPGASSNAHYLKKMLKRLPKALHTWERGIRQANCLEHTSVSRYCDERDAHAIAALTVSLYAQVSMERRFGYGDYTLDWLRSAAANIVDCLVPMAEELARGT
jgi:hypothetical protein